MRHIKIELVVLDEDNDPQIVEGIDEMLRDTFDYFIVCHRESHLIDDVDYSCQSCIESARA